jgi:hypothetical protein
MIRAMLLPATLALLLAPATSAQAGLLTVEDTVVVTDSSGTVLATATFGPQSGSSPVGIPLSPVEVGDISFGSGATFTTDTAAGPRLDFESVPIANGASATEIVHFVASATGFTTPPSTATLSANGELLGAGGSSITAKWYEDPLNGLSTVTGTVGMQNTSFNIFGSQVGTSNAFTAPDNANDDFSFSQPGIALPSDTPYSLTLEFDLTLTGGGSLGGFGQAELVLPAASGVPEPTTLTLLGVGSLGLISYRWRRRKQPARGRMDSGATGL